MTSKKASEPEVVVNNFNLSAKRFRMDFGLPDEVEFRIRRVNEKLSPKGNIIGAYYRVTAFVRADQESVIRSYRIWKSWYVYYDGQITDKTL